MVKVLCSSIVHGHIGGDELVLDAFQLTPFTHGVRSKLAVIRNENLQGFARLYSDSIVPNLEGLEGSSFRVEGNTPYVARKIVS